MYCYRHVWKELVHIPGVWSTMTLEQVYERELSLLRRSNMTSASVELAYIVHFTKQSIDTHSPCLHIRTPAQLITRKTRIPWHLASVNIIHICWCRAMKTGHSQRCQNHTRQNGLTVSPADQPYQCSVQRQSRYATFVHKWKIDFNCLCDMEHV